MDNKFSLWVDPFEPIPGATGTITATTGGVSYVVPSGSRWAEVKNNGSAAVRVGFGIGVASIPLTNAPTVTAGTTAFIRKPIGATHIGFRADAGTSVTYTMGNGNSQPITFPDGGKSPWLAPLEVSPETAPIGAMITYNILNATEGSVIRVTKGALPEGMTLNSANRTILGPRTGRNTAFMLTETLWGAQNSPNNTAIHFIGGEGADAKYLNNLTLSPSVFVVGSAGTGNVIGRTPGSTMVANGVPFGMTFNGAAGTLSGTPDSPGVYTLSITETMPGYANSPRMSSMTIVIELTPLNNLSLSPATAVVGTEISMVIVGKSAGSTLTTSTLMPEGMVFNGTTISGTPTTAGQTAVVIIETLNGAPNSPKSNTLTITVTE